MRLAFFLNFTLLLVLSAASASAQQRLIYDDDCSQDVDCVTTLPMLYALADHHEIKILAMVADSADPYSAPTMRIFAKQGDDRHLPIGANLSSDPATPFCQKDDCNGSKWAEGLVARFDAGDSRTKYLDCVTVYRRALAHQPAHSVAIVATGFSTCLNQLLASPPDSISRLPGDDLVRQQVKLLSIMGGSYPAGSEWNFQCDSAGYHALLQQWTKENGYPPVYLNGFANGEHVLAGPPAAASPLKDPTRYGMDLAGTSQRPMWDMLSVLFAARGLAYKGTTYFTQSRAGTVTVSASDGSDSWSSATDSGHYVLTTHVPDEVLSGVLQGLLAKSGL